MQHITIKLKKSIKKYFKNATGLLHRISGDLADILSISNIIGGRISALQLSTDKAHKEIISREIIIENALSMYVKQPSNNNQTLQAILNKLNELEKRLPLDRSNEEDIISTITLKDSTWARIYDELGKLPANGVLADLMDSIRGILKDKKL